MLGWELPPHNSGGLGVACYHMARALANRNVAIDFVLPYQAEHPDIDWMNIHAATDVTVRDEYDERSPSTLAYSESFDDIRVLQRQYLRKVEELVRSTQPDAIHAHDWLTMEAGIRARELTDAPLIVHVHATEFDRSGSNDGNPLIHEIEYQGLMMADRIIAVSNATKAIIIHKYGIPADKIEVVHNALDLDQFYNSDYHYDRHTYKYIEELRSEGYTVVSTVTRFTIQKGLAHLVKAAARACEKYDKFVFLLAGDGEQRDELIRLAADHGIGDKVVFTGFVRGKQWRDVYNVSDIFVMSSVSEPFGLTALEAAHHGNALIITKQSGVSEVLDSIYRYDFWDVDRLADQLVGIATSSVLRHSLKENVAREYSRITWADVAEQCLSTYHKARRKVAV